MRLRVKRGSVRIALHLNKAYLDRPRFSVKKLSEPEVPRDAPDRLQVFRKGLVDPSRVVEVAVPGWSGGLKPGIGFIAVFSGEGVELKGNAAFVQGIPLSRKYFSDAGGSCAAALLFTRRLQIEGEEVDGYALSRFECRPADCGYAPYMPGILLEEVEAELAARILKKADARTARLMTRVLKAQNIDANRYGGGSAREAYAAALGGQAVKVFLPNLRLVEDYEEAEAWLGECLKSRQVKMRLKSGVG